MDFLVFDKSDYNSEKGINFFQGWQNFFLKKKDARSLVAKNYGFG